MALSKDDFSGLFGKTPEKESYSEKQTRSKTTKKDTKSQSIPSSKEKCASVTNMGVDKSVSQTHSLAAGSSSSNQVGVSATNISSKEHTSTINDNRSLPVKKLPPTGTSGSTKPKSKIKNSDFMDENSVNISILEKLNSIVARQDSLEKAFSKPQSHFPTQYHDYEDELSHSENNILSYPHGADYFNEESYDYDDQNVNYLPLGQQATVSGNPSLASEPDQVDQQDAVDVQSLFSANSGVSSHSRAPTTSVMEQDMFSEQAKRFNAEENCSQAVNANLAQMVNKFFREGVADEKIAELLKSYNRPDNCDGLSKIKINPLVWNIIPQQAKTIDKNSQAAHSLLVKSGTVLTQLVDSLAKGGHSSLVEQGLDALAMLGQMNKLLVFRRREALKPVIQRDFLHLCSQTVPYTNLLFGDDVTKNVKEIQDMERIKKMVRRSGPSFRPSSSTRFAPYSIPHARGRGRGRADFRPKFQSWGRGTSWQGHKSTARKDKKD